MRQVKVAVAYGTLNIDQALARAREYDSAGVPTMVVGIVRNPNTQCWWLCISRCGHEVRWVSAHRRRKEADAQVNVIHDAVRHGALSNDAVFARLVEDLASEGDGELHATLALVPAAGNGAGGVPPITESFRAIAREEPGVRARMVKALRHAERALESARNDG